MDIITRIKHKAILAFRFFTFLIIKSNRKPNTNNKIPATTKSDLLQFTSSVNLIAINGISNRLDNIDRIMKSLLFLMTIIVLTILKNGAII